MYQRRRTGADPSGFRFALAWRAIPLTEFARFAHSDMGSLFFFLVVSLSRPRWMGSGEKREICDSVVREAFFLSGEIGQDTGGCQSLAPCFSYCSLGRFLMASWRQTDSTGHLLSHHVNLRTRQRATYLPTT